MKSLDRILRTWRMAKAKRYIPQGARVLDVGCGDGAFLQYLGSRIREGVGIDPDVAQSRTVGSYTLIAGRFPDDLPELGPFDAITMLAVLEHFPEAQLPQVVTTCARLLRSGGVLVITVPSPKVDAILHTLQRLRLVDCLGHFHEHHQFNAANTPQLFAKGGLSLLRAKRFQLGLNNLFVLQKPHDGVAR